jgi:hypothetical protein
MLARRAVANVPLRCAAKVSAVRFVETQKNGRQRFSIARASEVLLQPLIHLSAFGQGDKKAPYNR